MASDTFEVWVNLLNKNQPQLVETLAVDRAIIQDRDIRYILDTLPAQAEARIDQKSLKPYIGVDLFYGKEGSVKGLVFVTHSHALVVRIPDNAAKTSAERYEKKKLEQLEDRPKPAPRAKYKGQKQKQPLPEKTAYERLRQLLDANLAAFGMAQISLTLWDTLRERVDGVNLSTVTSEAIPAPARKVPDPNALASNESDDEAQGKGGKGGQSRGRGGNGQRGRRSRGGRGGGRSRGQGQGRNNEDKVEHKRLQMIDGPELPEDKEECRDRKLLSPGYVVNKLYPHVSRMDINSVFFGEDQESEMLSRVAEAISRAWIAHLVANHKEVNPLVQEAPIIKPSRLNDEELTFFSKSMVAAWRVMGEEEAERAIEKEDIRQEKNQIISQSHKKRIKASKNQEIRVRTKEGEDKVYYGKKVRRNTKAVRLGENELTSEEEEVPKKDNRDEAGPSRGKKNGHHRHIFKDMPNGADEFTSDAVRPVDEEGDEPGELPLFDIDNLESVVVYGRAEATRSEDSRDMFILRLLEGRAALRGEEFEDCEFIRRVWFPTQVQTAMGKKREAKNAEKLGPKKKERYDWVEDSWGDDTDEEEAAHVSKNKVPDSELRDSDTEDDELGYDLQASVIRRLIPALENDPNTSQMQVIGRITAPNPKGRTRATLVHGPPGTGKTSTISAAAVRLLKSGEYIWIVAQSNAGISNVAKSLQKIDFNDFVLIVAEEYYSWWEGQYATLLPYVIRTTNLNDKNKKTKEHLQGKRLILCTLASLSNPAVEKLVMFRHVPLRNLIIDEASQIDMTSEFMHLFFRHRNTLRNVCWFGDPMQLPPYGWSETAKINDIFKVEHLQANSKLMNISYRLPIPIADFIGKEVYQSQLQHHSGHKVKTPTQAMLFVDTLDGEELKEEKGTSFMNHVEAEVVVQIIELYYNKINEKTGEPYEFTVITPYEAQRRLVQGMLKSKGINREVYNVDSFQGNEADFIITTLTKTTFSSFLSSINRLNVLLTRCKKGLVVVSKKEFITRTGGLLRGLWWEYESHDIWKDSRDVIKGHVDLPGSPAPNPPNEGSEEESEDEDSGDE